MQEFFEHLQRLFVSGRNSILYFIVLFIMGLRFLLRPDSSLLLLLRLISWILIFYGIFSIRDFSYDPSLHKYNTFKKIRAFLILLCGILLLIVPYWSIKTTGLILGIYMFIFSVRKLYYLRNGYFSIQDCLFSKYGIIYSLVLIAALCLIFNFFLILINLTQIVGSLMLILGLIGIVYYIKDKRQFF